MNKIIYKYEIPLLSPEGVVIKLPKGAKILYAGMQRVNLRSETEFETRIFIWAMVDPDAELEPRTIHTVYTGVEFSQSAEYISSFIDEHTRLVYHIFVGV